MPDHDDVVVRVVREWVIRAEEDWITAGAVLKLGKDCPTRSVCFHAQQCIEKYLKAIDAAWHAISENA